MKVAIDLGARLKLKLCTNWASDHIQLKDSVAVQVETWQQVSHTQCFPHSPTGSISGLVPEMLTMKERLTWPLTRQVDDTGLVSDVWRHQRIDEGISDIPLVSGPNVESNFARVYVHLHMCVLCLCQCVYCQLLLCVIDIAQFCVSLLQITCEDISLHRKWDRELHTKSQTEWNGSTHPFNDPSPGFHWVQSISFATFIPYTLPFSAHPISKPFFTISTRGSSLRDYSEPVSRTCLRCLVFTLSYFTPLTPLSIFMLSSSSLLLGKEISLSVFLLL